MRAKIIISVFVLSLALSGCFHLPAETATEQITNKTWAVSGNTYITTIEYEIPEGTETNTITLVIENRIIKSVNLGIKPDANKTSLRYQQDFATGITPLIVGKNINELGPIDRVSGASYTTTAFNEAIKKLQAEI